MDPHRIDPRYLRDGPRLGRVLADLDLVDIVGVTTLVQAGFYPTAAMYLVYGGFCVWGFLTWVRVRRELGIAEPATPSKVLA